jgi:hypothetical protein
LAAQHCPFLSRTCVKQRKSDAAQTIGACTVGFQSNSLIICPHRFIAGDQIFHDCVDLLTSAGATPTYRIIPEVQIPGGNVDYFLVASNGDIITDYVGIEIQSLDTTGSGGIWDARQDINAGTLHSSYSYGINWRMSAKTILMQMHHKSESFEGLGKKLVLVVQAEFFAYMVREFSTTHLREASPEDSVHFHIYDISIRGDHLELAIKERKSTSAAGINQMLMLGRDAGIADNDVKHLIQNKWSTGRDLGTRTPIQVELIHEERDTSKSLRIDGDEDF